MRTVFKSIFVTVAIVVFGWMFTFLVNSLSIYITDSPYIRGLINMYAGITVNIGTMSNIFVFYAINTEYRDVIRQMLCKQRKIEKGHEVSTMHGLADSRRTKFSGLTVVHG
ncbi:hypothetical protein Q1695_002403 [Nippostrongylus brasiliensis]|nr:hypothetical protein Q1695_002403 [Nippostrongylus brasiliensis]